jgi:hypothetical protein
MLSIHGRIRRTMAIARIDNAAVAPRPAFPPLADRIRR